MGVIHKQERFLLSRYVDQELKDHERSAFVQHLRECASCREQLQEYEALNQCLAVPVAIEAPSYLWTRIRQSVQDTMKPEPSGLFARLRPILIPVAGAALVVLALVTGVQLSRTISRGRRTAEIQAINNPEQTTAPANQLLPDDTLPKDTLNGHD
jgi:anti-sigma factor RsiW